MIIICCIIVVFYLEKIKLYIGRIAGFLDEYESEAGGEVPKGHAATTAIATATAAACLAGTGRSASGPSPVDHTTCNQFLMSSETSLRSGIIPTGSIPGFLTHDNNLTTA